MGDPNQRAFLLEHLREVQGPILEVGSLDAGNTTSFRGVWPACEYVGVDARPGRGVDQVQDLAEGPGTLPLRCFALAICCSVLEHTPRPWAVAGTLAELVRPGGHLFVSVPWVWRYHPCPEDYFRFSFRALPVLFPTFQWGPACYSTNVAGERWPIASSGSRLDDEMAVFRAVAAGKRKYLPYLMVNALGARGGPACA